jgi:hypothetical protein
MDAEAARGEGLLERSEELRRIDALLASAAHGDGGLLAIDGPAGTGKTGLLEAAAARARERYMAVALASGSELERDFAFGVARRLFEETLVAPTAAGAAPCSPAPRGWLGPPWACPPPRDRRPTPPTPATPPSTGFTG